MRLLKGLGIVFCISAVFVYGCRKPSSANWDVDGVIPLVQGKLNIRNFLGDTLFTTDNSGLLYLSLNREIASLKLDSLFNLPDTTFDTPLHNTTPFPITLNPGQLLTFFQPTELEFNIGNGAELKRAEIRKAFITARFSNDVNEPLDLIYSIPGAVKNGVPFTIQEAVPPGKNSLIKTYDLSGYSLNLRGPNNSKHNTIVQTYTMGLSSQASSSVIVYANQGAKIEVTYSEVVPQYIEGYFGQQKVDLEMKTVDFGLNKNFRANGFMLEEATMDFKLLNEFGAEFNGSLFNINAINTVENKTVALQTNKLASINIDRANKSGTAIFPSIRQILLNNANSNVAAFISALPNRLTYQGTIYLNPNANISAHNDFAFYNTGVRVIANISIPLKFNANYFTLNSETEVNFSSLSQLDKVQGGNFVIIANNGYPFDATLQAYMLDANKNVIDSLASSPANVIERGVIDAANIVTAPVKSTIYLPITKGKIENLKKCHSLRLVSKFGVPQGPQRVKLLDSYNLDLNIVAEVTYNVSN